jgi:hypothetical protein
VRRDRTEVDFTCGSSQLKFPTPIAKERLGLSAVNYLDPLRVNRRGFYRQRHVCFVEVEPRSSSRAQERIL